MANYATVMNVEQGLSTVKYQAEHPPSLNLNQPTSHSGPPAPQWDNSDLIIAFIPPPEPVIANSDDLANKDDILGFPIRIPFDDYDTNWYLLNSVKGNIFSKNYSRIFVKDRGG